MHLTQFVLTTTMGMECAWNVHAVVRWCS